jgi:hypothetical protein
MLEPEITDVTWSPKGVSIIYTGSMVVHISAADLYPLAVKAKVVALVDTALKNMTTKAR